MLIATITTLVLLFGLGGSNTDSILQRIATASDLLDDHVADDARVEEARAILGRMTTEIEGFRERVTARRGEWLEVDANYEATAVDYETAFDKLHVEWDTTQTKLLDLRFALKKVITREEWGPLFKAVEDAIADGS